MWLVFLIASIFLDFKELPNNAQDHVSLSQYILLTLKYLPTLITFREPDMLLATPFWGGFGWHDANLPRTIIEILAGGAGVGLLLLLVHVWKTKARARALWLGIWGLGSLGTGVLTAALLYLHGSPNLNGRYLIGFYMIVLSICFSGYSFWLRELSERAERSARAAAAGSAVKSCGAAVCVALHGYSLLLIIYRYFG